MNIEERRTMNQNIYHVSRCKDITKHLLLHLILFGLEDIMLPLLENHGSLHGI
jgi:hypothetical protein